MRDGAIELRELDSTHRWRPFSRKTLIASFVFLVLFGCVFFFGLRKLERAIAFHPAPYKPGAAWVKPAAAEDVWFVNANGLRLHGWWFKSGTNLSKATVIFFHGNAGNVSNVGWVGERLAARGFNALIFDYRGYGRSEGALNDEEGLYADADAAYEYVLKERKVSSRAIVLYGQSLGTAAVADLAARHECAAIILESGPSSGSEMATVALPWLPRKLHFLARNRFETARKLSKVHCPVLITHGNPDPTVPTAQARALLTAANEPKKLLVFPQAGHNVFGSVGDKYLDMLAEFIGEAMSAGDSKRTDIES